MGFITRSLGFKALSVEDPSQPLMPNSALFESLGLGRSDAGVLINEKQAMRLTTVYSCVKVISQDLGRLSFDIFKDNPDGSVAIAKDHRCYPILHDRPNPTMSTMTWLGAMIGSMLAYGNGYSYILRDRATRVIKLVPLDSGKTSPVLVNGDFQYATTQTQTGHVEYIDPEDILHFIMPPSLNGIVGMSPIQSCKNAFGLGIAAEKFGAQFFGNGARATGVLNHPGHLDPEAYENLKKSVHEWANGETALRPIILEEGMDWKQVTIAPNDAQFLETRKFQKEEIAQLFRVPLHLLQDLSRSTNNNIEHQGLDYVRYCLMPIAVSIEQEVNFKILGNGYTCSFNFFDMERGDFASQTTGLLALRNGGIYSGNDVLRALRQNPIPKKEGGDIRIVQSAFIPLDSLLLEDKEPAKPETNGTDSDLGNPAASKVILFNAYRKMIRDAVGRTINRNNDPEFVKKAFHPSVSSMMLLLQKKDDLTKEDNDLVASMLSDIATQSQTWDRVNASEIATQLTSKVYDTLAGISNESTN